MGKLTRTDVASLTQPGRYTDGDGLTLYVVSKGRQYWQLRYRMADKRRDLSLGAMRTISLHDARDAALNARLQIGHGIDPLLARRKAKGAQVTFAEAAERVHALRAKVVSVNVV